MAGYGPTTLRSLTERLHRVTRRGCARPWDVSTEDPIKYRADRDGDNPEEGPLATEMSEMWLSLVEKLSQGAFDFCPKCFNS